MSSFVYHSRTQPHAGHCSDVGKTDGPPISKVHLFLHCRMISTMETDSSERTENDMKKGLIREECSKLR